MMMAESNDTGALPFHAATRPDRPGVRDALWRHVRQVAHRRYGEDELRPGPLRQPQARPRDDPGARSRFSGRRLASAIRSVRSRWWRRSRGVNRAPTTPRAGTAVRAPRLDPARSSRRQGRTPYDKDVESSGHSEDAFRRCAARLQAEKGPPISCSTSAPSARPRRHHQVAGRVEIGDCRLAIAD